MTFSSHAASEGKDFHYACCADQGDKYMTGGKSATFKQSSAQAAKDGLATSSARFLQLTRRPEKMQESRHGKSIS